MEKKLFAVQTKIDLERCFPILKELRPSLTLSEYIFIYDQAHRTDGYEIVAIEENGKILSVMGYRILYDFVRGKHIYIDDLVSTEEARSKGLGAELLFYAESVAKELNCNGLRLCTGLDNNRGMKFYERNGWIQRAIAYTKKL
ncbi:MAG: GNAT family N-acetyltransferase [Bacteriovorax sp.]|nr:GNAT family N-acetyltransferase [Bacteriovorax sp.]